MPLYAPDRCSNASPEEKVEIVRIFLIKCREWAVDREISPRLQQVVAEPDQETTRRLHDWVTYRDFLDHTIRELEEGTLDRWFLADPLLSTEPVPDDRPLR